MFTAAVFMSLYVTSCMSVLPSQCGTLYHCDDIKTWSNYTKKDLMTVNGTIYDIAISQHTGNIYVASGWYDMLVVMKDGNITNKQIDSCITSVAVGNISLPRVYIGTEYGLRIYDELTGVVTNVTEIQYLVWKLFVAKNNGDVYVRRSLDDMVYRYRNMFREKTNLNIEVINNAEYSGFVVDLVGNYYYTTSENQSNVTKIVVKKQNITVTYNGGPFECLAVDNIGRVFGTVDRDVYYMKLDGSTQKVATLDVTPWYMCFDEKNNVVIGTENNKVVMLEFNIKYSASSAPEFNNKCLSSPASGVDITSNTSHVSNITCHNFTNELENMNARINETIVQNVNMYNNIIDEIKSLRNTVNNLSNVVNENKVKLEEIKAEQVRV